MTKIVSILLFLFLTSNLILAQNNDSLTQDIRIKYNDIRTNLASFDTTKIDIWGESAEGGLGTAFMKNLN